MKLIDDIKSVIVPLNGTWAKKEDVNNNDNVIFYSYIFFNTPFNLIQKKENKNQNIEKNYIYKCYRYTQSGEKYYLITQNKTEWFASLKGLKCKITTELQWRKGLTKADYHIEKYEVKFVGELE